MQSKFLATVGSRCCGRVLSSAPKQWCLQRGFASRTRTADPAIHSGELEGEGPDVRYNEPLGSSSEESPATTRKPGSRDTDNIEPLVQPKPPHVSSPRLETHNQPLNPHTQQKRQKHTAKAEVLEEATCDALDGSPFSEDGVKEQRERDEHGNIESDKEYFSHNKASPLSEIEIADTRKPITRATDGTADAASGDVRDVISWQPEQLVTAEETLRWGAEMFRQNAMRGDPETFRHSRVLRELRGEWF